MRRRHFLRAGATTVGAAAMVPAFWRWAYAREARPGEGPYGPLGEPDENGIRLPEGFTSRVIAVSQRPVGTTGYVWHTFPDGGATFPTDDGGWVYVSNSEVPVAGGVGAVRFDADGNIVDAYPILTGTSVNCAGGPTPWNTWLSCEEQDAGRVWECDPYAPSQGTVRPALGTFVHEAAAVDQAEKRVYLTEDVGDGGFYRFTYERDEDLSSGLLEIAAVAGAEGAAATSGGQVTWHEVPNPNPLAFPEAPEQPETPTRYQVEAASHFDGGEGIWFDAGEVFFTTKGDDRVWAYEPGTQELSVIYHADALADPPLTGVDNLTVAEVGDIYVAEDGGDMQIVIITPERIVAPFLQVTGHTGSELAGPAFDPSGNRLYFSSQRGGPFEVSESQPGAGFGITYEITGPFRQPGPSGRPAAPPTDTVRGVATPPALARGADDGELPATGPGVGVTAAGLGALALGGAALAKRRGRSGDEDDTA